MRPRLHMTLGWLLPLLCLGVLVITGLRATRPSADLDLKGFGSLPVVANGRVQPLDALARNGLLVIQGRQRIEGEESPASPIAWLAELAFRPDLANQRRIFRINHDEVLGQLGFTQDRSKFVSYAELQDSLPTIEEEADRIAHREVQLWSPYEKALMQLARSVKLYGQLKHALALPGASQLEAEMILFLASIDQALAESEKRNRGEEHNPEVIANSTSRMRVLLEWAPKTHVFTTPSGITGEVSEWRRLADSVIDALDAEDLHPSTMAYARMGDAYRKSGSEGVRDFKEAVSGYRSWLSDQRPDAFAKGKAEALFNKLAPFYASMALYLVAFLLACFSWIWPGGQFRQAAFRIMLLGFLLHSAGLLARMALEGRPPVTNLYSSAVFIGWGAILLSVVVELMYRNAVGTVVAAIVGFATLLVAHHLSLSGDTLEMMRAVLDSNFWLATHVVVITLGYAATFLAGAVAIVYLLRRLVGGVPKKAAQSLRGMVYGIICFATLASFVGTVLGGIWADQSWGRFWGWDPKENGALLIVLWNAIILHARWGGIVRERGMMVMAVFGNIVTSWSWFGTNMLGIGLHSYGFTNAAFTWLSAFVASQLIIMGLGFVRIPGQAMTRSADPSNSGA